MLAQAVRAHLRALNQAVVADEKPNGDVCFYQLAEEGTEVFLRKVRDLSLAKSGRAFRTKGKSGVRRRPQRTRRLVDLNPPAKPLPIGLGRETDSVDHVPAGVEKFSGIEPIARPFFNRYESLAPARKEKLEIATGRVPAAWRAPDLRIGADAARHSPGVLAEGDHAAKSSHPAQEHGPPRKERNQRAPAGDAHVCTKDGIEQRIGGEDALLDLRSLPLRYPMVHEVTIQKEGSAV